jgi:hypothetical protein
MSAIVGAPCGCGDQHGIRRPRSAGRTGCVPRVEIRSSRLRGERGILLVNDEGIGWAPEAQDPIILPWHHIASLQLKGRGRQGLGPRALPTPSVWLGVQTVDGGATSLALSSAGARSLAGAAVGIPALALSTAAGWIGWQTDEGRFADETSAFAVAGALFVTAGFLLFAVLLAGLVGAFRVQRW